MSPAPRSTREGRIAAALEAKAREAGAIGMSAGVARVDGSRAFAAWGVDGRHPDTAMTPVGRFRIGSVTKTFTAALVLDLVDHGRFELDDTIEQWIPSYPYADQTSLRSLLTHTAGTADMTADAFPEYIQLLLSDLGRRFTPDEVIALMAALPPYATPGESYR
jgi:D-alanyl-D-alanine carboxypeptidase